MEDILRKALRKYNGLRQQLDNVLLGDEGDIWEAQLKNFLAKRSCWTTETAQATKSNLASSILNPIYGAVDLEIDPTDGTETLANAADVFTAGIDGDFEQWGTNVPSGPTDKTKAKVFEMTKDRNFQAIFTGVNPDLDKLCLEQSQIKAFVRKHKKWLRMEGYATLFLFKVGEGVKKQYFVADVRLYSGGPDVFVHRFSSTRVWSAEDRRRVVLPQQTLES